jgi:hypothetical protein
MRVAAVLGLVAALAGARASAAPAGAPDPALEALVREEPHLFGVGYLEAVRR